MTGLIPILEIEARPSFRDFHPKITSHGTARLVCYVSMSYLGMNQNQKGPKSNWYDNQKLKAHIS
jgi:hypothetical protein